MADFVLYYSLVVGALFLGWLIYVVRLYHKIGRGKN